ncbi:MAG TPA: cytochrome c oxidase subunit II [Verrucomicrobiae bacterium]|nr:cytochrome c oxidase subunit II [Verrucomicrobiae bacterium]
MLGLWVQLSPDRASTVAGKVDHLFYFLIAVSVFFAGLIFTLILVFAVKYRRRPGNEIPPATKDNLMLEILWTAIPAGLTVVIFLWGARLFYHIFTPPTGTIKINVVAKQWMWKIQHPEGKMEIDELHLPLGRPVELNLISEDVIHDFFVPAFRVKHDVLPGRYSVEWFKPTKTGKYHFFCSQYCGTGHSRMVGWVYVMTPRDYQRWLTSGQPTDPLAVTGERLFQRVGCAACHGQESNGRGPSLVGLFGQTVHLQNGRTRLADDDYLRESILRPNAELVEGYQPVMPTFKGILSEEQILELLAYMKSLPPKEGEVQP